jgi:hypothetical protein
VNLSAEVAAAFLEGMPGRVVQRLLRNGELSSLLSEGRGEIAGVGAFNYADISVALADTPMDASAAITTPEGGGSIYLTRRPDGNHVIRGQAGVDIPMPELGLLDPDPQVRRSAVDTLASRARPWWPQSSVWRDRVAERPLSAVEFGEMLDDLGTVAEHVLALISEASRKDRIGVSDIVPNGLEYFVSLVGPHPGSMDPTEYVKEVLTPHLTALMNTDLQWGLRCLQAVNVAEELDPVSICRGVSSGPLLSALQQIGGGYTASSALTSFMLVNCRRDDQPWQSSVLDELLNFMLDSCASERSQPELSDLHLSLFKLTLGVISQAESLASLPPYWRRLAAFVHATFLLEVVDFSHSNISSLVQWCDAQRTPSMISTQLMDRAEEPLWNVEAQSVAQLFASALVRALRSDVGTARGEIVVSADQQLKLDRLSTTLTLLSASPSLMSGRRLKKGMNGVREVGVEVLGGEDGAEQSLLDLSLAHRWQALAHAACIYRFTDALMLRMREEARSMSLLSASGRTETYLAMENVAAVAACQPDVELAEIVADAIVASAADLDDSDDVLNSAALLLIASGFEADNEARIKWAAQHLTALAFRAKVGVTSRKLAAFLASTERLIRLTHRHWGRAVAAARAASS